MCPTRGQAPARSSRSLCQTSQLPLPRELWKGVHSTPSLFCSTCGDDRVRWQRPCSSELGRHVTSFPLLSLALVPVWKAQASSPRRPQSKVVFFCSVEPFLNPPLVDMDAETDRDRPPRASLLWNKRKLHGFTLGPRILHCMWDRNSARNKMFLISLGETFESG